MRVTAVSVAVHDATTDRLVFRVAAGPEGGGVVGLEIAAHEGIAGYVFSTGQPLAVADVVADPRFERTTAERTGYVPRSLLAVPLADEEGTLGVMEFLDRRDGVPFDLVDLETGGRFAAALTASIRATRLDHDAVGLLPLDPRRLRDERSAIGDAGCSTGPPSTSSSRPSRIGSTRTTRCGGWPTGSDASARRCPRTSTSRSTGSTPSSPTERRRDTAGR